MIKTASDLFDTLAIAVGVVAILWLALRSSRHAGRSMLSAGAKLGLVAWLAAFAVALYLIFG
jgi:hypothetical protein